MTFEGCGEKDANLKQPTARVANIQVMKRLAGPGYRCFIRIPRLSSPDSSAPPPPIQTQLSQDSFTLVGILPCLYKNGAFHCYYYIVLVGFVSQVES